MNQETALWVADVGIPILIAWCVGATIAFGSIIYYVKRLVNMHEEPDKYGFGTSKTNKVIEDNTRAMQALTHYVLWEIENRTGTTPPPPKP